MYSPECSLYTVCRLIIKNLCHLLKIFIVCIQLYPLCRPGTFVSIRLGLIITKWQMLSCEYQLGNPSPDLVYKLSHLKPQLLNRWLLSPCHTNKCIVPVPVQ
ncbi:hypothetical protein GDO86_004768 [Hymenochirus boettgeri]|uniref:Uncharacterized protein n=1 Tax=Hymenochirus boettgeri TaxID=247094 RepID=A0A8T2K901_9PIPI|nr:hypothetical protein GDO86_004768 [Hymenochirus boettgeri]